MTAPGSIVALDVGGTSVKSAVVGEDGQPVGDVQQTWIDSRGSAAVILETLAAIIQRHIEQLSGDPLLGAVLGFPGPFEYDTGVCLIQGVDKYEAIYGLNIGQELAALLETGDLPIIFCNDAEAALVGEARHGAGRNYPRVIGVTLGTGCGSSFLVDGVPVSSGVGVPPGGVLYHVFYDGQPADDLFSIRGLERFLDEAGVEGGSIQAAANMARNGHKVAQQTFAQFGHELGLFLRPWVEVFPANAVVLGGGIARAFDLFGPQVAAVLPVPVVQNALGAEAALMGAAGLFLDGGWAASPVVADE